MFIAPPLDPHFGRLLAQRIQDRTARVAIIGLGYVGLPLAQTASAAGFRVCGYDSDTQRIATLDELRSPITTISHHTLAEMARSGFTATSDPHSIADTDIAILCVPTPLTAYGEPDLQPVIQATRTVARKIRPGCLIVLESTTYPSTTRTVVQPILEAEGLRVGYELFLAYSPERLDPGHPDHTPDQIPKLVGGLDSHSRDLAVRFYSTLTTSVIPVSSPEVAETAKLLENAYRAVNIALVNELKIVCDALGIDVWEVIEAAATKPFGFQSFSPGPGLGGHCVPIDPLYLAWSARQADRPARLVELAATINASMPDYVIGKLQTALAHQGVELAGAAILILGVAYKRNVDDTRESPGLIIMDQLIARGARVSFHDPFVPVLPTIDHTRKRPPSSVPLTAPILQDQHAVLIVTDHSSVDYRFILDHARLIVDTRNVIPLRHHSENRLVRA
ncbi:MAG: nucleotide sugar dehydrogenase [Bacteroidales bacterium]|nr:nucleotide sugar dehydrogenase [Bacteroidales bacterium]